MKIVATGQISNNFFQSKNLSPGKKKKKELARVIKYHFNHKRIKLH